MSLVKMDDDQLLAETKKLAERERKIQVELLWHLLEIQRRKLFLRGGFSSLYDYVVKELGYGHGAAYRRIQAMRLLESVPAVAAKIEEGLINISTAAQVQNFIKSERKGGSSVSYKERVEMVKAIENKSTREVEKHFIQLKPDNVLPPEKVRFVTAEIIEMRLMVPDHLKDKLDKLRLHFSHINPDMTYLRLVEYLADKALAKMNQPKFRSAPAPQELAPRGLSDSARKSRHIPSVLRHAVWVRDGGKCSYRDPKTGRKCQGSYQVQVDHIRAWSQGGESVLENLQLLCAQHNRLKGAGPGVRR